MTSVNYPKERQNFRRASILRAEDCSYKFEDICMFHEDVILLEKSTAEVQTRAEAEVQTRSEKNNKFRIYGKTRNYCQAKL